MRDPLAWIPIRYKLPLTFVFFCLLAFGLGGYAVTSTIRESLGERIRVLLDERADSLSRIVGSSLGLMGKRTQDFASDGHIRVQLERLTAPDTRRDRERQAEVHDDLRRHLLANKLPLVAGFEQARLFDVDGNLVLSTEQQATAPDRPFDRDGLWFGSMRGADDGLPFPSFVISTPVASIQGGHRLGYLQILVRADRWAAALKPELELPDGLAFDAHVQAEDGHRLVLVSVGDAVIEESSVDYERVLDPTGWTMRLVVDSGALSGPVDSLLARLRYLGLALVLLILSMLLFPQKFLLKPLAALQDAAKRIAEGDFSARVEYRSKDEVGDLAGAFNVMATAVEERTRRLEQAAEVLERREEDIRFERDRLNAVIRSMEDGLFILDAGGRVTLSNAAARPVIEVMSHSFGNEQGFHCSKHPSDRDNCLACVADPANHAHSCVVGVGDRVYEINGTALYGQHEARVGKVFVSRDVTERVRQTEREAHQERLAVLGEIAAVMAHELNNPLAAISMFSQMLLKGLDVGSPPHDHAEVIHRNTETCKSTIRALLDMATTSNSEYDEFDIHDLIADVIQLLEPLAQRSGVALRVGERASSGKAFGDELQLRQAVVNLVMNSVQALSGELGGRIVVSTENRGEEIAVVVGDNGPGVPASVQQKIFEPFFTTKPPGDGTGLGLPTSRRIVETQGGRLTLRHSRPGCTEFELAVPRRAVQPVRTLPVLRSVRSPMGG